MGLGGTALAGAVPCPFQPRPSRRRCSALRRPFRQPVASSVTTLRWRTHTRVDDLCTLVVAVNNHRASGGPKSTIDPVDFFVQN